MSAMNPDSTSNTKPEHPRPWLVPHYVATRQRTADLVKTTVDRLIQGGQKITLEAICKLSRELDPQGKGITKDGILGNTEAYAYCQQRRTSPKRTPNRRSSGSVTTTSRLPTDPQRDLNQVRRRYLRERKPDLVERLLTVEQAYIDSQQQLARLQFELLEKQQEEQKKHQNRSF
jgi:hypothetical protein